MPQPNEYSIDLYSRSRFFISFIALFLVIGFLGSTLLSELENKNLISILLIILLIMCYFFASRLSKASAKIIVTEKSITHIWNKKFMLSKEDDLTIPWGEIKSYGLHGDRLFDNFEFNLKNKTRYQINRLSFVFYKDDFKLFIADLPILTEKNGTNVTDSEHRRFLADSKDSLAPKIIKGFIILVGLLFTFMLLSKIFIPDSQINWTGIYVTGAVLVLYLIYLKLNNANIR